MNIKKLLNKTNKFLNKDFSYKDINNENIDILREIIIEHNTLYHKKEDPVISDEEYDKIFLLLQESEKNLNNYKDTSPTNKLSVALSSQFQKVLHKHPMLSLWNTYNKEDLLDFDTRLNRVLNLVKNKDLKYAIELKFDWLWINLLYQKWKLIQALTRWNWIEWEDVTINILQIKNIPKTIPYLEEIEIRWEVVLPFSSFKQINKEREKLWQKLFSNPRNAASWSVRLLNYSETKKRNLEFFAYNVPSFENDTIRKKYKNNKIKTYSDYIKELNKWWFHTSPYFKICNNIKSVINKINNLKWKKPWDLDFEVDWLVIKLLDLEKWTEAWMTAHHPRHSIAYKFKAQNVRTRVLDIEHSVWRTWIITPVAILEPVKMDWVIISRATLHNYDELNKKWVRIKDYVFIERAWEVIPEIISVIIKARDWSEVNVKIPKKCPSCWFELDKEEDKVAIFCPNKLNCLAQIQGWFETFVWKTGINIDWLWKAQIALFLKKWFIKDFADIYDLSNFKDEILKLEWYKEKSVKNLLNAIELKRKIALESLLTWLWIPWVWKKTAQILSKYISSNLKIKNNSNLILFLKDLWKNKDNSKLLDLENIQDIWPETAKNIIKYFLLNKNLLNKLLNKIEIIFKEEKLDKKNINLELIWKTFCITWSFDKYKRPELIELWEKAWLISRTWVTKKLDYLIAWEKAWTKKTKAESLWVKIIGLKDFLTLINIL